MRSNTRYILLIWIKFGTVVLSNSWRKRVQPLREFMLTWIDQRWGHIYCRALFWASEWERPDQRNPSTVIPVQEIRGPQGIMLKNTPHLVRFKHCSIVSIFSAKVKITKLSVSKYFYDGDQLLTIFLLFIVFSNSQITLSLVTACL